MAIQRGTADKYSKHPRLVSSKSLVFACEDDDGWSPDVYRVVKDLVYLKAAPLQPLLRRSAALGKDSPVTLGG